MPNSMKKILDEYVKGLFKIIGNNLKQVILYGSYARGEQEKNGETSDIDILILVDLNEDKIKKVEKMVLDYSYEIDLRYDVLLSPIIENVNNYEKRTEYMEFYKNIKREGVLLNV